MNIFRIKNIKWIVRQILQILKLRKACVLQIAVSGGSNDNGRDFQFDVMQYVNYFYLRSDEIVGSWEDKNDL